MNFITHLRVKNFFSVKDETDIDFKASQYNIENNRERLFEFNGEFYNKIISFYGANASGKTTLLKAITIIAQVIKNEQSDKFPPSFKNKFAHLNSNSEIEIGFVLNQEKFIYSLKFKSQKYNNIAIEDEELYLIKDGKRETFFNRKDRKIQDVDDKIQEIIFNNLSDKKSLFQEFSKFNYNKVLLNINAFFNDLLKSSNISEYKTKLNTDLNDESFIGLVLESDILRIELSSFFIRFFNSIGLDIDKIEPNFKYVDGKEKEFLGLKIFHKIDKKEPLEFNLESDGTQMLMKILLDIYLTKIDNSILVIDELDSIIHPILVPIIVNLLIENNIQLIYSTHNIYNMQFLQNDEIFLIEKDNNHKTIIKPIKDNSEIKGYENLLTHYENGYLGGIPNIEDIITKIL